MAKPIDMKSKLAKRRLGKNNPPPEAPGELIRCDCGTVCDLEEHRTCPECGAKLQTKELIEEKVEEDLPVTPPKKQEILPPSPTTSNEWMWKLAKYAGIMLLAAYALRLTLDWLNPSTKDLVAVKKEAIAERTTEEPKPEPTATPEPPRLSVDSRLVGDWEQFIGGVRWSISIRADGTYNFETSRPMQIPSHRGTFSATDGQWQLHSQTIAWDDFGSYQVPSRDSFVMYGKLGTGMWKRKGTQISYLDPQPTPARRSNYQAPAPTPNHRVRNPQRGSFVEGVFEDFAKRLKQGEEWLRR